MLTQGVVVSAGTFASRLFGLARDILLATLFGVSDATDAFFVAFKIPNFFRRLFAEGSFSQAFIPILSEYSEKKSEAEILLLIHQALSWLLIFLLPLTIFGVLANNLVINIYAIGFSMAADTSRYLLASDLVQITFSYLLLISITAFCSAVLQTNNRFAIPALTPIWLNICLIAAMLFGGKFFPQPIYALAWGVLLAGFIQLIFQLPSLYRIHRLPIPQLPRKHSGVMRIMRLMLPTLFAVSVHQINLLIDIQLAAFLQSGSISWLSYGDRIMSFPLAVIGIAVTTVVLPKLSKEFSSNNQDEFRASLLWGMRTICVIGLPAALGIFLLAPFILATLFYYGSLLTLYDVEQIAMALRAYAIGLPAFMLIKLATASFFSRQNASFAVKAGIVAVVVNIIASIILIQWLDHAGLALATSIAGITNLGILLFGLCKAQNLMLSKEDKYFFLKCTAGLAVMAIALSFAIPVLSTFINFAWWARIIYLACLVGGGIIVYSSILWISGLRLRHFTA